MGVNLPLHNLRLRFALALNVVNDLINATVKRNRHKTVASPGFGARRGTCRSYWVFTGGNCRHV